MTDRATPASGALDSARPDMVLVLPPWQPSLISEYCALPWLAAHGAAHGYTVETLNLNRELLLAVARGEGVAAVRELLRAAVVDLERASTLDEVGVRFYLGVRRALDLAETLSCDGDGDGAAPDALEAPLHLLKWLWFLDEGMGGWVDARACWGEAGERIWRALGAPVMRAAVVRIATRRPRAVGFCVPYSEVVPATFELVRAVREALGSIHIALGGPAAALASDDALRQALDGGVDSIVRYDAEDSFVQLLEAVRGERALADVDNRLGRERPIAEVGHTPARTRMSRLPARSYRFEAPLLRPVNLLAAHGCVWGKCAYCCYSALHGPTQSFRSRSPEAVVDEIEQIHQRYGARDFLLSAESLPRRFCRELARGLLARGLDVRWCCFVRPGPWYDLECLDLMVRSGFDARWSVSIEAGSDAVLQRMRRGYCKKDLIEFFERCRAVGMMFGWANVIHDFPGTTYDEALETFELVAQHVDLIRYGVSLNRFRLKAQSAMGAAPHDFGLTDVVWRGADEATFASTAGMSADELARIERRYGELELRFRPEAADVARLSDALERGELEGLRVALDADAVACCPSAFDRDGRRAADGERIALYPSGSTDEVFYFQYNIGQDLARAAVLDDGERSVADRLIAAGCDGLPVADVLALLRDDVDSLRRLIECGAALHADRHHRRSASPARGHDAAVALPARE